MQEWSVNISNATCTNLIGFSYFKPANQGRITTALINGRRNLLKQLLLNNSVSNFVSSLSHPCCIIIYNTMHNYWARKSRNFDFLFNRYSRNVEIVDSIRLKEANSTLEAMSHLIFILEILTNPWPLRHSNCSCAHEMFQNGHQIRLLGWDLYQFALKPSDKPSRVSLSISAIGRDKTCCQRCDFGGQLSLADRSAQMVVKSAPYTLLKGALLWH